MARMLGSCPCARACTAPATDSSTVATFLRRIFGGLERRVILEITLGG